jgi:hypothetical protein
VGRGEASHWGIPESAGDMHDRCDGSPAHRIWWCSRDLFASSLLFLTFWSFPLCHSGTISESKGLPMHSLRLRLMMSSFHGSLEAIYLRRIIG